MNPYTIIGDSIFIGDMVVWRGVLDWPYSRFQSILDRFNSPHRSTLLALHRAHNHDR